MDQSEVVHDVVDHVLADNSGVGLEGNGEIAEEFLIDRPDFRAGSLKLMEVTIEGSHVSDQSERIRLGVIQVVEGLFNVSNDWDISALVEILVAIDFKGIVETLEDFSEVRGVGVKAEVSRGEDDAEGEDDELVHDCYEDSFKLIVY